MGRFWAGYIQRKGKFYGSHIQRGANFKHLRIKEKILFEGSGLKKASFVDTDLRKIDFINCTWPKRFGRNLLYDEISLFAADRQPNPRFKGRPSEILKQEWDGFKKDISCNKEATKKVEILYRMLKQKYKEEHNEYEVSDWHYGEKEMFRKGSYFRRFFPLSLSNLYWFSSGYGERPVRAGIVLIFLIIGVSILMTMSGLMPSTGDSVYSIDRIKGFDDILDLSKLKALILNTLQYATLQKEAIFKPESLSGAYLKLFAQILIPVQTALFALAIKNRFKR